MAAARELDSYIASFEREEHQHQEHAEQHGSGARFSAAHDVTGQGGGWKDHVSESSRSSTTYGRTMTSFTSSRLPSVHGDHLSPRVFALLHGGDMSAFTPRQRASWLGRAMQGGGRVDYVDGAGREQRREEERGATRGGDLRGRHAANYSRPQAREREQRPRGVFPATHPIYASSTSETTLSSRARNKLRRRQRRRMFTTDDYNDFDDEYWGEEFGGVDAGNGNGIGDFAFWDDGYDEDAPVDLGNSGGSERDSGAPPPPVPSVSSKLPRTVSVSVSARARSWSTI